MESNTDLDRFLQEVPWSLYATARYAFVAASREGALLNLGCSITLEVAGCPSIIKVEGENEHLVVRVGWIDVGELRVALENLSAGNVLVLDESLLVLQRLDGDGSYQWSQRKSLMDAKSRVAWPARWLSGAGSSPTKIIEPLDSRTIESSLPTITPDRFASLRELEKLVGGPLLNDSYSASVDIFAPVYARLGRSSVAPRSGQLQIAVESLIDPKVEGLELLVGQRGRGPGAIPLRTQLWSRTSERGWTATAHLAPGAGWTDIHLTPRGRNIDHDVVAGPSLAASLYQQLDPDLTWLRQAILPVKRSPGYQREFEAGIVALLNLGNMATVHYGRNESPRGFDFIAYLEPDRFMTGDCTVEAPAAEKFEKLFGRAGALKSIITQARESAELLCALFLPVPYVEISAALRGRARDLEVALVSRERIEELLTAVVSGDPPRILWAMLERWRD